MQKYNPKLKSYSRKLRQDMTDAEQCLWMHIRRKQCHTIQFYRQRPIGEFIVDFYASKIKLIIEIDGGQHFTDENKHKDKQRDQYFSNIGLTVLRFNNRQVLQQTNDVIEQISHFILNQENKE